MSDLRRVLVGYWYIRAVAEKAVNQFSESAAVQAAPVEKRGAGVVQEGFAG
jgi:hypothetical protein